MESPSVVTTVPDEDHDIVWEIVAYRHVDLNEAIFAIRSFLTGRKMPKAGSKIQILTTIGVND